MCPITEIYWRKKFTLIETSKKIPTSKSKNQDPQANKECLKREIAFVLEFVDEKLTCLGSENQEVLARNHDSIDFTLIFICFPLRFLCSILI